MAGPAPDARSRFATRLKRLRLQRGYERARAFARALGIEENRYTRYERAEVEPSLMLLHQICATLNVTPNELLDFAEATPSPVPQGAAAAAGGLGWRLASAVVELRRERLAHPLPPDPLEGVRATANLFAELQAAPFGTVAAIARDPGLLGAAADRRSALAELIKAFTDSLTAAAP